jgi:hypothetical protein
MRKIVPPISASRFAELVRQEIEPDLTGWARPNPETSDAPYDRLPDRVIAWRPPHLQPLLTRIPDPALHR